MILPLAAIVLRSSIPGVDGADSMRNAEAEEKYNAKMYSQMANADRRPRTADRRRTGFPARQTMDGGRQTP
jgi:hypothetical protein